MNISYNYVLFKDIIIIDRKVNILLFIEKNLCL